MFSKFSSGVESLENDPPPAVNDNIPKAIVHAEPHIQELSRELGFNVSNHLRAIGKVKKLSKWMPHQFTESNDIQCYEVYNSLLVRYKKDLFLNHIVTYDQKWFLHGNQMMKY